MNYLRKNINLFDYILTIICLISFWGGIVYRFYSLNTIGVIISLTLAIISFIIILYFKKTHNTKPVIRSLQHEINNEKPNKNQIFLNLSLVICYLLLAMSSFFILFSSQTVNAIVSPWQVVPNYFFAIYVLATTLLIIIILKSFKPLRPNPYSLALISLHYFLSFSIALIVYKIGYGFDPFIHQATVDLINKTGSVDPKPFYYLGQYGLIIILHKITTISLIWLDKLLVPLLAAIYLPITLWKVLQKWFSDKVSSLFLIIVLLILPFSFFIVTTPQNLAYLFLIITILLGLICNSLFDLIIIYLLSLTAIIIQPIAGIPALMFAILLTFYHSDIKTRHGVSLKKYFYSLIFIISSLSLPIAFLWVEKNFSFKINASLESLSNNFIKIPKLIIPGQENFILNFIYLYIFNIKNIILLIAITGIIIAYKHREKCKIFFIYFLMSSSMLVSYFLTQKLPFSFLIEYERSNYTDRILIIATLFLFPFILISLYNLTIKTFKQAVGIKIPIIVFITILITTSLYASYPRFDRYFNSRGYSASQSDINAVHWIKKNAEENYIVLANQQVSVSALREFGFAHYYKDDIFYYPIPTGGPMYQYYLDMVYKKPSRDTMSAAMNLVDVKEGYFVLNKYWWAFPKILEEAKLEAQAWEKIDNGEIYIFKYQKDINIDK